MDFGPFFVVLRILGSFWWFWLFWPLFLLVQNCWIAWRQRLFEDATDWILLEMVVPRETKKSPLAMEQVLLAIHALKNAPGNPQEYYLDGEITRSFSLEIVSLGGETHFYVRAPRKQKDLVEAAFYSYYPDIELREVNDYIQERFPTTIKEMYRQGYDLWGAEMVLSKSSAYPIKTYKDFEAIDENRQFDPISNFLEVLAKVKKEEIVGIQFLIAPGDAKWAKEYDSLIEKIKESKTGSQSKSKKPGTMTMVDFPGGPLPAFTTVKTSEVEKSTTKFTIRTPGETSVLEAVETNLSKQVFETIIRFVYLSPKTMFFDSFPRRGLKGAFNQYSAVDLNSFDINWPVATRTMIWNSPYIFPKHRNEYKKQRMLYNYRHRETPPETFMGKVMSSYLFNWNFASRRMLLTTQSIATLFHPPTFVVLTAPHMKRIESRKAGPPAGLAIFGDEEEMDKFTGEKSKE